jgi:FAD/FMN-containing dehydrogenase/Fe-S oxidoreductase
MEPAKRNNLYDDLRGIVRGELRFDDLTRVLYASDASLFEVEPAGVVIPRDEEDLAQLIRYAAEQDVSLTARGAGTGLAGESLTTGLVVDLSVHFRQILSIGEESIRAQAGVTWAQLDAALAPLGRRLNPEGPTPEATLGGILATNASGPRAAQRGTAREMVESLGVILDSGDRVELGRVSRWPEGEASRLQDIVASTITLLEQNAALIEANRPRVVLDRCGYALQDVLGPRHLHLARLMVGSEGTLGLLTEATLRTVPRPQGRAIALLAFARMDPALRAARLALSTAPTACEILDRRLLRLARGEAALAELVPDGAEAVLLAEFESTNPTHASAQTERLIDWLHRGERLAIWSYLASHPADCDRVWRLRTSGRSSLATLRGVAQPVAIVEDVAVPPEELGDFLPRVQDVLRRLEISAAFLLSAGTGQVQMSPFLDLSNPRDADKLWKLADTLYPLVWQRGGTISSRHGTGLARMPWLGRQVGPISTVYRDLKTIFDPRFLFNPGKVVPQPAGPLSWPLRRRGPLRESLHLVWDGESPQAETNACNGCGSCRSEQVGERMCPIFRATGAEAATPRAKANLMRHLLHPQTEPSTLTSDEAREVAELCVNCKMCATECPSRVQIPRLMLETRAAYVAKHGLGRGDWVFARTESFAWLGSALAPIANAFMSYPFGRWLLERIFSVSRHRRLPRFAAHPFMRLARKRGWTRKPQGSRPCVAYFVDIFANYNDPLIAQSVVAVLHHNGIEVYVPPGQVGCGMAALAYGDADTARDAVRHNLRIFADLAREGFPIVCSEPTAALMLQQDALTLLDDSDARLVAAHTIEWTTYLAQLHARGQLRTDFEPIAASVGHHVPCHLKALGRGVAGPGLLALIPQLRVQTIDVSCSGMAGTFGFRADRYETSLKAGAPMLEELRRPRYLFGSTECSACRLQMEDGTGKRTLHPAQYLALAYGLMPALATRLREPLGDWLLE